MKTLHFDLILLILILLLGLTFEYYLRTPLPQFQFIDHYNIKAQI